MSHSINTPLQFRLVKSTIDQFAFFEGNNNPLIKEYETTWSIEFKYDSEERLLYCLTGVECCQNSKIVTTAAITLVFELRKEAVEDRTKDGTFVIPSGHLSYFASKTCDTLRGVLMAKLEPTTIRITLPLINPEETIKKPIIVKL